MTDSRRPVRILMLDDDHALLRMATLTLTIEGFDVATAADGIEGLNCLETDEFDAIVLDLQMPRMDGRTFFREMRRRGIGTPVVLLSAYQPELARIELGAEAAIRKPFEPEMLARTVYALAQAARDQDSDSAL